MNISHLKVSYRSDISPPISEIESKLSIGFSDKHSTCKLTSRSTFSTRFISLHYMCSSLKLRLKSSFSSFLIWFEYRCNLSSIKQLRIITVCFLTFGDFQCMRSNFHLNCNASGWRVWGSMAQTLWGCSLTRLLLPGSEPSFRFLTSYLSESQLLYLMINVWMCYKWVRLGCGLVWLGKWRELCWRLFQSHLKTRCSLIPLLLPRYILIT